MGGDASYIAPGEFDEMLAMVPTELHTALVAHFKAKKQTIKIRVAYATNPFIVGDYNHSNTTISLTGGGGGETFLHEYGHMIHYVLKDKYGSKKFSDEWMATNGRTYSNKYPDTLEEDVADTFMEATLDSSFRRYYNEYKDTGRFKQTMLLDKVASSVLKIKSIYIALTPQTPSPWATEAVSKAFAGDYSFYESHDYLFYAKDIEGVLGGTLDDTLIYQNAITRAKFCNYLVIMLDKAYEKKTGKRLAVYDDEYMFHLLDVKTGEYIVINKYSAKPLTYFDDSCYDDYVAITVWYGLVSGVSETRFDPYAKLTRQDAAIYLHRACTLLGLADAGGAVAKPADSAAISSSAANSVDYVLRNGLMSNTGDGNFSPMQTYSYEQAIVALVKIFDNTPKA